MKTLKIYQQSGLQLRNEEERRAHCLESCPGPPAPRHRLVTAPLRICIPKTRRDGFCARQRTALLLGSHHTAVVGNTCSNSHSLCNSGQDHNLSELLLPHL